MQTSNMAMLAFVLSFFFIIMAPTKGVLAAARLFKVGDELGWQEPDHNTPDFYNQWAQRNRFQLGDSLSFEYKNDSVIEVKKWGFYHCDVSHPISAFNNGKSKFNLDKPGPFYFISGATNHCKNGQRLVVEVMGSHHHYSPPSAISPDQSAPSSQPSSAVSTFIRTNVSLGIVMATVMVFSWHAP